MCYSCPGSDLAAPVPVFGTYFCLAFESDLNYSPHFPICKMRWESTNVCTDIGLLGHTEEIDSDKSSFLAHFQTGLFY